MSNIDPVLSPMSSQKEPKGVRGAMASLMRGAEERKEEDEMIM